MGYKLHVFAAIKKRYVAQNYIFVISQPLMHLIISDVARKLAKLNAKTSISEDPSKLPEEARKFTAASKRSQHHRGGGGGSGGHSSFHRW